MGWEEGQLGRRGSVRGWAAAAAADRGEAAVDRALVAGEAHFHALALVALAGGGPHHLALLAVHDPILEGPREVDLLSCRVAARWRRWRLAAYLCDQYLLTVGMYSRRSVARGIWGSARGCMLYWLHHAPVRLYFR